MAQDSLNGGQLTAQFEVDLEKYLRQKASTIKVKHLKTKIKCFFQFKINATIFLQFFYELKQIPNSVKS